MSAQYASISDGLSFRRIVAIDVFSWNLRLGFAIAPRDKNAARERRRRARPPSIPAYLRADLGFEPEEDRWSRPEMIPMFALLAMRG